MSLFKMNDLFDKKVTSSTKTEVIKSSFVASGSEETLRENFGTLEQGRTTFFVSQGDWALHDMVRYFCQQTGPVEMIGFSWSLTMPAAEKLLKLKQDGFLKSMRFLFDAGMSKYSREAVTSLKAQSEAVKMRMIHAKGFLLWNSTWNIACISSANFSNNPRIEAGYVTTHPEIFAFNRKWAEAVLENAEAFESVEKSDGIELPPPEHNGKTVFLIRGLPGSGKSSLARMIADVVCENDELFTNGNRYQFIKTGAELAESHCFAKFKEAIADDIDKIAVANVFAEPASMERYERLAGKHGYRVHRMVLERCEKQNIHGIPEAEIEKMRKRFEVKP